MLTFSLESHTHTFNYMHILQLFFYQHSLSFISWGIVLERYLNNDLLTYSCQVCSIVSNRNVRLWMRVRDMTHSVWKAYGLLCYMCTRFMYVKWERAKKRRWDCVAFLQHNHRPNEMQCNRVFEGQHVISPIYCNMLHFLMPRTFQFTQNLCSI